MLAVIIILLALILCVLLGITRVIVFFLGLGFIWVCIAILGRNNPQAVNETFLWSVGLILVIGFVSAIFTSPEEKVCPQCAETIKWKAEVCKHCGHHQPEPERRFRTASLALADQFDSRRWKNMTLSEYAGAGIMVIGIAVVGFFLLYVLIPQ